MRLVVVVDEVALVVVAVEAVVVAGVGLVEASPEAMGEDAEVPEPGETTVGRPSVWSWLPTWLAEATTTPRTTPATALALTTAAAAGRFIGTNLRFEERDRSVGPPHSS